MTRMAESHEALASAGEFETRVKTEKIYNP